MNKSLNVMMEEAKMKLFSAFNQIQQESSLPAYLLEGHVLELLAEIRNRKNFELVAEINKSSDGEKENVKDGRH